jgi:hypothetical protein
MGSFFRKGLMDQATVRDAIRLSQIAGPASSGWMAARPSASLGLSFDPATYRVLLRWHLGIPLLPPSLEGSPCPLGCGSPVDSYGDHVVCCRKKQSMGEAPWHTILPKPVLAECCYPPSPRAIDGRRLEKGRQHPHPLMGCRHWFSHRCGYMPPVSSWNR